jgi:glycosyltransferase involved in cell wall biosynthesis
MIADGRLSEGLRDPAVAAATGEPPADLAVIMLAHNEERHLGRALDALAPVAREIFVVDSFSTDRTVEIALARGATVLQNRFVNYARQFQWALDTAPVTSAWVMRLDADEVIEPDLAAEIRARLPVLPAGIQGVVLKRKHIFMGRWIRHGGRYPLLLLRIWRRGAARIEDRWMDEHMVLSHGRTVTFAGGFADHNLNDLTFFTDKHNKYATREAIDVLAARHDLYRRDLALTEHDRLAQASWKRAIKEGVYNRLPFQLGPAAFFLYRYIVQLGFLDGKPGLVYHFLQGFWYRFLVEAKVYELEQAIAGIDGRDAMLAEISRRTGHRVGEVSG